VTAEPPVEGSAALTFAISTPHLLREESLNSRESLGAQVKKQLTEQWVGILFGGIVASLVISFIFYNAGKRDRKPTFYVDKPRTVVLDAQRAAFAPLVITKRNGSAPTQDIVYARYYLWNDGTEAIRKEDVLREFTIRVAGGNILGHELLTRSRPDITHIESRTDSAGSVIVTFSILEKGDGCSGHIIYEGTPDLDITCTGIAVGHAEMAVIEKAIKHEEWKFQWIPGGPILLGFIIALISVDLRTRVVRHGLSLRGAMVKQLFDIFPFIVIFGMLFVLFWFSARTIQTIPAEITKPSPTSS